MQEVCPTCQHYIEKKYMYFSGEDDLMLMNTPQGKQRATRHPAARALQEQVDGDGAPKEAHVVDKMLFSPAKGEEHRVGGLLFSKFGGS